MRTRVFFCFVFQKSVDVHEHFFPFFLINFFFFHLLVSFLPTPLIFFPSILWGKGGEKKKIWEDETLRPGSQLLRIHACLCLMVLPATIYQVIADELMNNCIELLLLSNQLHFCDFRKNQEVKMLLKRNGKVSSLNFVLGLKSRSACATKKQRHIIGVHVYLDLNGEGGVTGYGLHGYSHVSIPFLIGQCNISWLLINKAFLFL